MGRRFPPLVSLRVFEAAARHLSFTKAAEELNVTQAAVSHQIKKLEDYLQTPLFLRLNRSIELTKQGAVFVGPLTQAFDIMATATAMLDESKIPKTINIATFDSIAANWLAPRIRNFQALWEDVSIKVITRNRHFDFTGREVDVEIRYGDGNWPGLHAIKITNENIFPVCSPEYLAKFEGDLPSHRISEMDLIHDELIMGWSDWLEAADVSGIDANKGLKYNHSHIVQQAAVNGEGVALGRGLLVADAISDGKLVKPFNVQIMSQFSYYLVFPKELLEQPWVISFRDWLMTEVKNTPKNL